MNITTEEFNTIVHFPGTSYHIEGSIELATEHATRHDPGSCEILEMTLNSITVDGFEVSEDTFFDSDDFGKIKEKIEEENGSTDNLYFEDCELLGDVK